MVVPTLKTFNVQSHCIVPALGGVKLPSPAGSLGRSNQWDMGNAASLNLEQRAVLLPRAPADMEGALAPLLGLSLPGWLDLGRHDQEHSRDLQHPRRPPAHQ